MRRVVAAGDDPSDILWLGKPKMNPSVSPQQAVEDYLRNRGQIKVRHRPETDTPLKNGIEAERIVNLDDRIMDVLDDYIQVRRHDVTDEFSREPLFTTRHGRLTGTTRGLLDRNLGKRHDRIGIWGAIVV